MIPLLMLAFALVQDPQPAPRTVEDRLKELEGKLAALEARRGELANENATIEKKVAEAKAARESFLRQSATFWVRRYAQPIELNEKQVSGLEELWYGWIKEDQEKPADTGRWKGREDVLRDKLTAEQIPRLARKVREEQEQGVKMSLGMMAQAAKLNPEKTAALEKAVLGRLPSEEGVLLAQAHPEKGASWAAVIAAVESSLPGLSGTLTEEDQAALRTVVGRWKPRLR
jgi:hypothetical protein